jgi:hypothetical protein
MRHLAPPKQILTKPSNSSKFDEKAHFAYLSQSRIKKQANEMNPSFLSYRAGKEEASSDSYYKAMKK